MGCAAAAIEATRPIGNYTVGQATRAIVAGIAVESAGTNCSIWVEEGVQCGGKVRAAERQAPLSLSILKIGWLAARRPSSVYMLPGACSPVAVCTTGSACLPERHTGYTGSVCHVLPGA